MLDMRGICVLLALALSCCEAVVKHPPQITKQPRSDEELLFQVVSRQDENDKPFIIECEANGEPEPKYRWMKNGKEFDWQIYNNRISQQPGRGTLVISSPRDEDFGQYQCFAQNELGTATSNSVFVRKSEIDSFKIQDPISEVVNEGYPVGLNCQPPDGYPKPQLYWMIQDNRGALRSLNSSRMTVDPEGTLWFTNVTRQDASNNFTYSCFATSTFRNEYKLGNRVNLLVYIPYSPAVQNKDEPGHQFVSRKNTIIKKGDTLELWCIYSGTPLPEIHWRKTGGTLPFDRVQKENYGRTLVIKYVDYEDAGQYECEASNGVGTAKSYTMDVHVEASPYFTQEPEIQNKVEGEMVEFFCETAGNPPPEQYWTFNGMMLDKAPVNPRRTVENNKITIYNLTKADTGNYGCNSSNTHGYVYRDVYVNVLDVNNGCQGIPNPESHVKNARVRCTSADGCRIMCKSGYLFTTSGEQSGYFICDNNNQWTIDHTKYNECKPQCRPPCSHGGTCVRPRTCDCDGTGYRGRSCNKKVVCKPDCQNDGLCINNTCVCKSGFSGDQCQESVKLRSCEIITCEPNAFCIEENGDLECKCMTGFQKNPTDSTCQDINECEANNGDCDHHCHNSKGSYNCSCQEGFHLTDDNKTCQVTEMCPDDRRAKEYEVSLGRPVFVPRCNPDGTYASTQCHEYRNYCWCSKLDGTVFPGTIVVGHQPDCSGGRVSISISNPKVKKPSSGNQGKSTKIENEFKKQMRSIYKLLCKPKKTRVLLRSLLNVTSVLHDYEHVYPEIVVIKKCNEDSSFCGLAQDDLGIESQGCVAKKSKIKRILIKYYNLNTGRWKYERVKTREDKRCKCVAK